MPGETTCTASAPASSALIRPQVTPRRPSRRARPDASVENRQPPESQQQLVARGQMCLRRRLHRGDVDVGLINRLKITRPSARASSWLATLASDAKNGDSHRDQDLQVLLQLGYDLDQLPFNGGLLMCRSVTTSHVKFELRAGLFDESRVCQPRFAGRAVEGSDDRDFDSDSSHERRAPRIRRS